MDDAQETNRKFGIDSQVCFKQLPNGIVVAEIDNALATATISLYGGHVVTWWPKHQSSAVLWISKLAKFVSGKAIRGGVPICWPWFGAHPSVKILPGHGYARISPWEVDSVRTLANGETEIKLTLQETDASRAHWPYSVSLTASITVGRTLTIELTTINKSDQEITLSEGLHTYFQIGDIAQVSIHGLAGEEYVDLVNGNARYQQTGEITFEGEVGRIYVNSTSACVIKDKRLRREIRIDKSGSLSTAVWNPWEMSSSKMDDIGANGWRDMVCVETANALENKIIVGAGATHVITAKYSATDIL